MNFEETSMSILHSKK